MTQGWFNHYDDPDEFWDEEPLDRRRPFASAKHDEPTKESGQTAYNQEWPGSLSTPARYTQPMPTETVRAESLLAGGSAADSRLNPDRRGSRFVAMELDRGFLPTQIEFSQSWSRYVGPHEVGGELTQAYQSAASDRLASVYSINPRPTPQDVSESAVPDTRTIMAMLLETATWGEYVELFNDMTKDAEYRVHGCVSLDGENSVTVYADRTYMQSIAVSPNWVASVDTHRLADELIWCANQIRSLRPVFATKQDYSQYSDEDLKYHMDRHRDYLVSGGVEAHGR
ncbi:hypothetical protein ACFVAV_04280 [Nocardia sp. NPDC057663]|uniref:hypothetical protein n=1 Tax=Nocardia sp. NPDC057663 TaxID=3346201 RepID=UPI0036717222